VGAVGDVLDAGGAVVLVEDDSDDFCLGENVEIGIGGGDVVDIAAARVRDCWRETGARTYWAVSCRLPSGET